MKLNNPLYKFLVTNPVAQLLLKTTACRFIGTQNKQWVRFQSTDEQGNKFRNKRGFWVCSGQRKPFKMRQFLNTVYSNYSRFTLTLILACSGGGTPLLALQTYTPVSSGCALVSVYSSPRVFKSVGRNRFTVIIHSPFSTPSYLI